LSGYGLWLVRLGGDDGDAFVEIEFGQANAASLSLDSALRATGRREAIDLPSISAAAVDVRSRCVRRRFVRRRLCGKF